MDTNMIGQGDITADEATALNGTINPELGVSDGKDGSGIDLEQSIDGSGNTLGHEGDDKRDQNTVADMVARLHGQGEIDPLRYAGHLADGEMETVNRLPPMDRLFAKASVALFRRWTDYIENKQMGQARDQVARSGGLRCISWFFCSNGWEGGLDAAHEQLLSLKTVEEIPEWALAWGNSYFGADLLGSSFPLASLEVQDYFSLGLQCLIEERQKELHDMAASARSVQEQASQELPV